MIKDLIKSLKWRHKITEKNGGFYIHWLVPLGVGAREIRDYTESLKLDKPIIGYTYGFLTGDKIREFCAR